MRELHLDFETFSEADLPKVGAYKYAAHPSTEVLMCSYFMDGWEDTRLWVPAEGEEMPEDLRQVLADNETMLCAWNANFERNICKYVLGLDIPIWRWRCAMVDGMSRGLPGKLEQAGPASGLPEELFKQEGGRRLINKFCKPKKPTKKNPATRWTPAASPEDWAKFKAYCCQDVRAETAIWDKLQVWRMLPEEQRLWEIDQEINDLGLQIDLELAQAAHTMGCMHREFLVEEAKRVTGLDNPNSTKQLIEWLNSQDDFDPDEDTEVEDLRKKTVEKILGRDDLAEITRQVLELRQQIAKSSLKKYDTLLRMAGGDGRVRGTLQFMGANRTGRWGGRGFQPQNLPQGIIEDLALLGQVREIVRAGDYETLIFMFGREKIPDVLATLIRTCVIAPPGKRLAAADLSAIEARVIAWFADCQWRLEVFRTHGKIYEASAGAAFKIPLAEILQYKKDTGKHHPIRKKGKVIELACGYQGGEGAMIQMGALDMGIPREELWPMVHAWREASPEIAGVKNEDGYYRGGLWSDVEAAAKKAIRTGKRQELACGDRKRSKLIFRYAGGGLVITLPSGRHLHYINAKLERKDGKGKEQITYWGVDQKTKRWTKLNTYGGKLVENIVQAFSRDVLREIIFRLHAKGYPMIMLVHDEIVFELLMGFGNLPEILDAMSEDISYAPGLPLKGDGFENAFYFKG